ncbi:MAG TPA: EamA family transporter [Candidatus Binatia bacterium]|jgi:drug/metabolite transporter (DMT)-like permease|nr:EamA family transporter [Candidatus Binatia bacterium]
MAKLLLILFIGLVFESTGIVLLKKGINQIGEVKTINAGAIARVIKEGLTNSQVLLGVFFEALFFICLLILMSQSDISFLWPLTALSFVFATVAAMMFLHERVSAVRWAGVVLIMLGAALISYSEQGKEKPAAQTAAQNTASN